MLRVNRGTLHALQFESPHELTNSKVRVKESESEAKRSKNTWNVQGSIWHIQMSAPISVWCKNHMF